MSERLPGIWQKFIPLLFLLITACTQSPNELTGGEVQLATRYSASTTPTGAATLTGSATITRASTATGTPQQTPTTSPSRQPTVISTPTRTRRATPTATASFTATPTHTPVPTAAPAVVQSGSATMLLVAGDYFVMGVAAEVLAEECALFERDCDYELLASASPQHPVYVDSFYLDSFEVTNRAYSAFLTTRGDHRSTCQGQPCLLLGNSRIQASNGRYEPETSFADHPVHSVTWYGAAAFCEQRGARLPTEAEWEMAASWEHVSNTKTLYPWGNRFDDALVNFCDITCTQAQSNGFYDDGYAETAPVGRFPMGRSASGMYDMGGNVWEWSADWFSPTYYSSTPDRNPQGPTTGQARVLRGGSWFDTGNFTATIFRIGLAPHQSNDSIGFRCAMSLVETRD